MLEGGARRGCGSCSSAVFQYVLQHFGIPKRLTSLPDLPQIGFAANRRLLGAQTISHDPIAGARAFTALTAPVITPAGTRFPGCG